MGWLLCWELSCSVCSHRNLPLPPKAIKKSNKQISRYRKPSLLSGSICFQVNSVLGDKFTVNTYFTHLLPPKTLQTWGGSWRVSGPVMGTHTVGAWLEFERVGTLYRDLGVQASDAWSGAGNTHSPRCSIVSWNRGTWTRILIDLTMHNSYRGFCANAGSDTTGLSGGRGCISPSSQGIRMLLVGKAQFEEPILWPCKGEVLGF